MTEIQVDDEEDDNSSENDRSSEEDSNTLDNLPGTSAPHHKVPSHKQIVTECSQQMVASSSPKNGLVGLVEVQQYNHFKQLTFTIKIEL